MNLLRRIPYSLAGRMLAASLLLSACSAGGGGASGGAQETPEAPPFQANASDIQDPASHYAGQVLDVVTLHLKTVPGDSVTLADVNGDLDPYDAYKPEIKVHFKADDFADDLSTDNAKLRIRGKSSRLAPQKSYRVKLNSSTVLWHGERTLQLNKQPWDLTRVRNKLTFDLLIGLPHLPSLRTRFAHVFIDSNDYGLFTHVENVGKEYLQNRQWNTGSNIYKAENYSFNSDARLQLDGNGAPVNKADFERVLELENGGADNRTLLAMTNAVADDNADFNATFNRYFNRNNYLTWLAVNILLGNRDTQNQNFYLYQPSGGERFYFLPWDYDGALSFDLQPDQALAGKLVANWQLGISNWWGSPLHRRFLKAPGNLAALQAAVNQIKQQYLTPARISSLLAAYKPLVSPLINANPDLAQLPTVASTDSGRSSEWEQEYQRIGGAVQRHYDEFIASLQRPMPVWQSASYQAGQLTLAWDASYDLQGDALSYSVEIATRPDFAAGSVLISESGLSAVQLQVSKILAPGSYYMRTLVRDAAGNYQQAFDRYDDSNGKAWFGVLAFTVN